MKKLLREFIFFLSLLTCAIFPSFCFASFDDYVDPRWKWYYSDDTMRYYVDTQSIEYDATRQVVKAWTLHQHRKYPSTKYLWEISFKDKTMNVLRGIIPVQDGQILSQDYNSKYGWPIRPDSKDEALANSVSSILHISPLYEGGPNRWKWVHSTDTYGLYVAKDTIVYLSDIPAYGIWAKKLYLDGNRDDEFYTMNFDAEFICTSNHSSMPEKPVPDSDEEYVFKGTRELLGL